MKNKILVSLLLLALLCGACFGVRPRYSMDKYDTEIANLTADTKYNETSALPIRVPEGVGILTIQVDDPLKTSYTVLYAEAKKRGIPITLVIPSMMSSLDADGVGAALIRATDIQVAEMISKGGACPVYHSTSHDQWQANDNGWFKNEVAYNCEYGDTKTTRTAKATRWWELAVADTPGDLIAAQIQANGFFDTDSTGATHITFEGFIAPGQWYEAGEAGDVTSLSDYWDILRTKWGKAFILPGGNYIQQHPDHQMGRVTIADAAGGYTEAKMVNLIEAITLGGGVCHIYSHEFLDNGETGAAGEGSANAGENPYSYYVDYDHLVALLNAVYTAVEDGKLMVLGFGASTYVERGTPVNLLQSLRGEDFQDVGLAAGWGAIYYSGSTTTYCNHRDTGVNASDGPKLLINRQAEVADRTIGWWHNGEITTGCQQFILSGWSRINSGTADPKIVIYGGTGTDNLTVAGSIINRPTVITTGTEAVGGVFTKPLYSYTLDGTDNVDVDGDWTYFQIPFTLPKPFVRYIILLTTEYDVAAATIEYQQLKLIPNGI